MLKRIWKMSLSRPIFTALSDVSIRRKLTAAFIVLAMLVALCGGIGLLFVARIAATVSEFSDVASPLMQGSLSLIENARHMRTAIAGITREGGDVDRGGDTLAELEQAGELQLQALIDIANASQLDLRLDQTAEDRNDFIRTIYQMIADNRDERARASGLRSRLEMFDDARRRTNGALLEIAGRIEAQIARSEDRIKVLVQTRETSIDELGDFTSDILNEKLPVLQSINQIVRANDRLKDLLLTMLAGGELSNISDVEAEAARMLKDRTVGVRMIGSRLQSPEERAHLTAVVDGTIDIQRILSGPESLFQAAWDAREARSRFQSQAELLNASEERYFKQLGDVHAMVRRLNTEVHGATAHQISQANAITLVLGLLATGAGLVFGIVFSHRITAPLLYLTGRVQEIRASGNPAVEADPVVTGRGDEVGILSRSFYLMLADLAEARTKAEAERGLALAEAGVARERERAAAAANNAKSTFLAMMSHEIRTPMNAVLGYANTLLDTRLEDEQRKDITAIRDAGDDLLEILNDILDFSKLEAGKLTLAAAPFSPESLITAMLGVIEPRAHAKGLALLTINDPTMPRALTGDASRIRQVLLNLVANAVKFTEAGEIVVTMRLLGIEDQQATVEWTVSDTGIGIDPERIGLLFNDFVQADDSIARRFGGTGLGLAICKRLIEQMGGSIDVHSKPGEGTTFRVEVRLPVAQDEALAKSDSRVAYDDLHQRLAALGRPLRLLITDDSNTNCVIAAKMLSEFAIECVMAGDGSEALDFCTRMPFDVVLMDMLMPAMDGLEATRAIRARGGRLAQLPIIAFTANAYADDVKACCDAGMTGFVAKPVRKEMLVEAIARAMASDPQPTSIMATKGRPGNATARTEHQVFDRAVFETLVAEIDQDTAFEALGVFVRETEVRLQQFRRITCETNRELIEHEAHSLKGCAGTFGLFRLADLARTLEQGVATMSEAEYSALVGRIVRAFKQARRELPTPMSNAA
jgi:signal transduction histidine kinase/DNA-binding response OmpR family regulator